MTGCTVLVGTRASHRACGIGTTDTCSHHRAYAHGPLPRSADDLPTGNELLHGARTRTAVAADPDDPSDHPEDVRA